MPRVPHAEQRWLTELQLWAVSQGASVWLVDLEPYERCRVVGVVERLRLDPGRGHLQATITDGTGEVAARWPIRTPPAEVAVAPGRAVVLEGFAVVAYEGALMLEDPSFRIVAFPEVA